MQILLTWLHVGLGEGLGQGVHRGEGMAMYRDVYSVITRASTCRAAGESGRGVLVECLMLQLQLLSACVK